MPDLHTILDQSAPMPEVGPDLAALDRRAGRIQTRNRALTAIAAVALVAVPIAVVTNNDSGDGEQVVDSADDPTITTTASPSTSDGEDAGDDTPAGAADGPTSSNDPGTGAGSAPTTAPSDDPAEQTTLDAQTVSFDDQAGDTRDTPFAPAPNNRPEPNLDIISSQVSFDPATGQLISTIHLADLDDDGPEGANGGRYETSGLLTTDEQSVEFVIETSRYNDHAFSRIRLAGENGAIIECAGCGYTFDTGADTVTTALGREALEAVLDHVRFPADVDVRITELRTDTVWVHTTRAAHSCDDTATQTGCAGPYANAPADTATSNPGDRLQIR